MSDEVQKLQDRRLVLAISNEIVGDDARGPIMSDTNKPAMLLDDLPRPGVVLTKEDKRGIIAEESAIIAFTEEVLRRMEEIHVSKTQLAEKLGIDPAAVSKLIGGENNFTLKTMVRIARALQSKLRFSLMPAKQKAPQYGE
jgi:DNA-binding Xre family transcriptional regulator